LILIISVPFLSGSFVHHHEPKRTDLGKACRTGITLSAFATSGDSRGWNPTFVPKFIYPRFGRCYGCPLVTLTR
jgi:hypothetical protein